MKRARDNTGTCKPKALKTATICSKSTRVETQELVNFISAGKVNAHKQSNLPSAAESVSEWKPRVAINLVVLWTSSRRAPLTGFSLGQCWERPWVKCSQNVRKMQNICKYFGSFWIVSGFVAFSNT